MRVIHNKGYVAIILIVACITGLLMATVGTITFQVTEGVQLRDKYYVHLIIAGQSSDPYTLIEELELSLEGLDELKLYQYDYTAYVPWGKTSYNTIGTVIIRTTSVIQSANDMIRWMEKNYGDNGILSEVSIDMYYEKMDNLRSLANDIHNDFNREIRIGYIMKHASYYMTITVGTGVLLPCAIALCLMVVKWSYMKYYYEETESTRNGTRPWSTRN